MNNLWGFYLRLSKVLGGLSQHFSHVGWRVLHAGITGDVLRVHWPAGVGPENTAGSSEKAEGDSGRKTLQVAGHLNDADEVHIGHHWGRNPSPQPLRLLLWCGSEVQGQVWHRGSGWLCGFAARSLLQTSKGEVHVWPEPKIPSLHGNRGLLLSRCYLWRQLGKCEEFDGHLLHEHHGGQTKQRRSHLARREPPEQILLALQTKQAALPWVLLGWDNSWQ